MLDQSEGCGLSQGIWTLKNKTFPKVSATVPAAKKDVTNRLITDPSGLKQLYLETFTHRLRERPAKESYSELSKLQESLLRKRLAITRTKKTPKEFQILFVGTLIQMHCKWLAMYKIVHR